MSNIEFSVPHQLSQEEALTRIKNLLSQTAQEHSDKIKNLKETWTDNTGHFSFSAMGYDIAGELTVNPSDVYINAKVPFTVSLFKGTITKMIEERAGQLLK
jgi:hypothetical protein